jgi:uncharacterized protein
MVQGRHRARAAGKGVEVGPIPLRRSLFVDASAWVALIDARDGCHLPARGFWLASLEARRTFLTSDYVLDEAYTLLRRRRNGLAMARELHGRIGASRLIEVVEIGADLRAAAWEIFTTYEDPTFSFTDCTSFALLRERRLLEAFTFDGDFRPAGFLVRPG